MAALGIDERITLKVVLKNKMCGCGLDSIGQG
jgi:hypothetical protein